MQNQEKTLECKWCGCELDGEERESPRMSDKNEVLCDSCWSTEYEGTCYRCKETVLVSELDHSPGRLIIVRQETDGYPEDLTPGYYRVKKWPFYFDGMIEGHMESDSLVKVACLEHDRLADEENPLTCGSMCKECQEIVERKASEEDNLRKSSKPANNFHPRM